MARSGSRRRNQASIQTDVKIRLGVPGDIHEIMELAKVSTDENAFLPPNMAKIATEIWSCLNRDHGLVGVAEGDFGRIEGVVILRIGEMWYSDQVIVEEKVVFVHPDFRTAKISRAVKLSNFAKKVSDDLGLPLLIGVLSQDRTEAKIRMYERQFGGCAGAFFLYNCQTGAPDGEWTADKENANVPSETAAN